MKTVIEHTVTAFVSTGDLASRVEVQFQVLPRPGDTLRLSNSFYSDEVYVVDRVEHSVVVSDLCTKSFVTVHCKEAE